MNYEWQFSWLRIVSGLHMHHSLLGSTVIPLFSKQHYKVGVDRVVRNLSWRHKGKYPTSCWRLFRHMHRMTTWWFSLWVSHSRISWPIIHQSIILNSISLLFQYPTGIILAELYWPGQPLPRAMNRPGIQMVRILALCGWFPWKNKIHINIPKLKFITEDAVVSDLKTIPHFWQWLVGLSFLLELS